jgi:two-component system nitrate/nitrite response regulator NarL
MNLELRVLVVAEQEVIRRGLEAMLVMIPEVDAWSSTDTIDGSVDDLAIDHVVIIAPTSWAADRVYVAADRLRSSRKIILIPSSGADDLERALAADASGYMFLGDVSVASLRASLVQLAGGYMTLPPRLASYLLDRARGHDRSAALRAVPLTPRERDVLNLLIEGLSNREIANRLDISIHGAKRHVSSILNKLDSPSRAHLVSKALQSGIVSTARTEDRAARI